MTEQEYNDRGDLVRVGNALTILRDIIPKNSSVINKGEHAVIMNTLSQWQDQLFLIRMIDK